MGKIRELGTEISEVIIDNAIIMPALNQINFNNTSREMVSGF